MGCLASRCPLPRPGCLGIMAGGQGAAVKGQGPVVSCRLCAVSGMSGMRPRVGSLGEGKRPTCNAEVKRWRSTRPDDREDRNCDGCRWLVADADADADATSAIKAVVLYPIKGGPSTGSRSPHG